MPVFTEFANQTRDLRVQRSLALPLPRINPPFRHNEHGSDRYEVVIVGAGPAGLMLELLLARYGLSDESLLCIDSKSSTVRAGQADGVQPRTLEVFKTLGLVDEIASEGCQMWEFAFWNPSNDPSKVIERTSIVPEVVPPARFGYEATIHQGRIERILETDLLRYSKRGILRNTKLLNVMIDESDAEFPVQAEIETNGEKRTIRTKHLVGADGAHSIVRQSMGLKLEGESLDHIWGVVDIVLDTNFPDIRRRCAIHSPAGSVMVIPREQISTGDYLTRLYVHIPGTVNAEMDQIPAECAPDPKLGDPRARRANVSLQGILQQASDAFKPYYIRPKTDGAIDWWAAYQIGQRLTSDFTVKDSEGIERIFIAGDACHTHSPKAGQGMNVSMMDSYNLAWKLAYYVNGLTPAVNSNSLLSTYRTERHEIAQQLIDFDRNFSTIFSGQVGSDGGLTPEQLMETFKTGNGFTSGVGIEYPENIVVDLHKGNSQSAVSGEDYLSGILRPGRRLLNVRMKRFADGWQRDLHDDLKSTGRFRILCLTSPDLLDPNGISVKTLQYLASMMPRFPPSLLEQIVVHPPLPKVFEWEDLPSCLKQYSEMSFYSGFFLEDVYKIYGVDPNKGALVVVRPDGYVGLVSTLVAVAQVEQFFKRFIQMA